MLSPVLIPLYKMSLVSFELVIVINIASIYCEICSGMSNFPLMREYF
jgi:hypothetical protein